MNRDSLRELRSEHRKLAMLRILQKCPAYSGNAELLCDIVSEWGLSGPRIEIRNEISALSELGLVEIETTHDVMPVKLTQRGLEVAEGRTIAEGVLPPGPECPY